MPPGFDYQNALGQSMITNNTYAMLHNTTVNVNANLSTTNGAATLLLNNLLQGMTEKENQVLSQSMGAAKRSANETADSHALYQFLKSKHLSKEIQQRLIQRDSSSKEMPKSLGKSGSKAYIDIHELKNQDVLGLYKRHALIHSSGKKQNSKSKQGHYDTVSSIESNTPSKP